MSDERVLRLTVPEGATGVMIDVQWGGNLKKTDGTGELSIIDSYDHFDEKDLEPAPPLVFDKERMEWKGTEKTTLLYDENWKFDAMRYGRPGELEKRMKR
jgi:hypothetical protein